MSIMKRYNILIKVVVLLAIVSPFITSCDEDDSGAAPVLDRVSLVTKDSTTSVGSRGTTYVIFGNNLATTQEVYFNDQKADLNTTYVRNDNIIVRVPDNAPYLDASNKIRVVTKYGDSEIGFEIEQPKAKITSFTPGVATDGSIVTITGDYFDDATVAFVDQKTGVATAAEIVFASVNELQVKVPDGTKVAYIDVTTAVGTTRAANSFGFNYIIYADELNSEFEDWSWGGAQDFASTTRVKSGAFSFKRTYNDGWSGIQIHSKNNLSLEGYTSLKISVYGGPSTSTKKINVNLNWGSSVAIQVKEGQWADFTIPLSSLGNPTNIDVFIMQDDGSTAPGQYVIYLDEVGLL